MTAGLFSTYKTGENRVAASMLAIPNPLALPRAAAIALLEQFEFQLIHFKNQPSAGGNGTHDAWITVRWADGGL